MKLRAVLPLVTAALAAATARAQQHTAIEQDKVRIGAEQTLGK